MRDQTAAPLPQLAPRRLDSHKGDYGRVLVLGGSRGMAGAPALAGMAAIRAGAGLVTIATSASVHATVASFNPCYMTVPLVEDDAGTIDLANVVDLAEAREAFDVWAVGPGLGRSEGLAELVARLYLDLPRPLVVDADGLNALAAFLPRHPKLLERPAGPRILTPHSGEFARLSAAVEHGDPRHAALTGRGSIDERTEQAAELCRRDATGQTIVVLKGYETIVCDGERFAVNETGNPGMATGGTGDCLTGVVAALAGQGLEPWDAARLGAHVHGLAGDLAAAELGQTSLAATDVLHFLPSAFRQHAGDA